jgi:poly(A) polymerase
VKKENTACMEALKKAKAIVEKITKAGYVAYYAGGWVRDYLLSHPSDDIDIATNATPEILQSLFDHTVPIGISFGIILIVIENESFEIATFRKDIDYVDGRRPTKVEFTDAIEDAKRRDFTINGMFYDPLKNKILDFVDGQKDLKAKVVKAIGDPHLRFAEDRLRMIRAVRIACRFNFTIDEATQKAILSHAKELLVSVAIERIWQELSKMASFRSLPSSLLSLYDFGLLQVIFPSLAKISKDTLKKRLKRVKKFPNNTPVISKILEAFDDISIKGVENLCLYLKLSKKDLDFAMYLTHAKKLLLGNDKTQVLEPIDWANFYASDNCAITLKIIATYFEDKIEEEKYWSLHKTKQKNLKASIARIKNNKHIITAKDLMPLGISPGIAMGNIIKEGDRIAANSSIEDKNQIITILQQSDLWSN